MVQWEIIITTIIMNNFFSFGVCYEPSTMLSTSYTCLLLLSGLFMATCIAGTE